MDFFIRKATNEDFENVYPLFEQLWPNKKLNKVASIVKKPMSFIVSSNS